MQKFERTMEVVTRVREAIAKHQHRRHAAAGREDRAVLRPRRSGRRSRCSTVLHNMLFGIALIFLIQWLFLGNLRSRADRRGDHPGGAVPRRHHHGAARRIRPTCCRSAPSISASSSMRPSSWWRTSSAIWRITPGARSPIREASLTDKLRRVLAAAVEVDKAIFFSVIITIAAFLPLFTMQGVEGQIFGPMARTYAYALTRRRHRHLHGDAGAGLGPAAGAS